MWILLLIPPAIAFCVLVTSLMVWAILAIIKEVNMLWYNKKEDRNDHY